jgi:hypothetical protein
MFYIVGSEVSAREDRQTEFKGHKNVSSKDIPPWLTQSSKRRTQSPISRAICGFLNTGEGGIVYIGVSDNGRVMGITYTCEEADHLRKSISNALSRFSPPVESNLWEARFIPALPCTSTPEVELEKHRQLESRALEALEEYHGGDSHSNLGQHRIPRLVADDYKFCWCEKNAMDLKNKVTSFPYGLLCDSPTCTSDVNRE